mmetsp:Transcript_7909/g.15715  ORF Transcript_7909/g.15715 Transcript_7909/m.15715 type:complete len:215 (-) Transcript_7909:692-1336(-)
MHRLVVHEILHKSLPVCLLLLLPLLLHFLAQAVIVRELLAHLTVPHHVADLSQRVDLILRKLVKKLALSFAGRPEIFILQDLELLLSQRRVVNATYNATQVYVIRAVLIDRLAALGIIFVIIVITTTIAARSTGLTILVASGSVEVHASIHVKSVALTHFGARKCCRVAHISLGHLFTCLRISSSASGLHRERLRYANPKVSTDQITCRSLRNI